MSTCGIIALGVFSHLEQINPAKIPLKFATVLQWTAPFQILFNNITSCLWFDKVWGVPHNFGEQLLSILLVKIIGALFDYHSYKAGEKEKFLLMSERGF